MSAPDTASQPSFSEASQMLSQILERFRTDSLPLEEALALFEEGVGCLNVCQQRLTEGRGRVEQLLSQLPQEGALMTQPFLTEPTEAD
ncbi:MAG: exodeoxyribonuclease VII small subunit [Candidatus Melainabacteria bacterium]|nr:exodeoxyribonuclease VII small subunit [Candidatus Melainabacteria bacterium]